MKSPSREPARHPQTSLLALAAAGASEAAIAATGGVLPGVLLLAGSLRHHDR